MKKVAGKFYITKPSRKKDPLTPAQRSYCMSQIKGKDTKLEVVVRSILHRRGYRFRKHVSGLPGRPDIVFPSQRIVVFLDGDFWHGYRFNRWKNKLRRYWRDKIARNIERDKSNFGKLRRKGWKVVRIWEHEVKNDLDAVIAKIEAAVRNAKNMKRD